MNLSATNLSHMNFGDMKHRRNLFVAIACVALLLLAAADAAAHEKWFHDAAPYDLRWDLFFRPLPILFTAGVLLVTAAAWWFYTKRGRGFVPGPEDFGATPERRSLLYSLIPLILGIHVAVPLLVGGVQGQLFAPSNKLPGFWMYIVGLVETAIALALFYGALTRFAAVALGVLWLAGVFVIGLEEMLESVMYLGLAAFFFCAGRGPVSIDRLVLPRIEPSPELMRRAVTFLRVGLGASLVFVAFTEKLANLPLAQGFLRDYPLNFTSYFGVPMSDEIFVLCAGSVELLVGLWLMLGIFPREIILIAWIPINMTLTIFNWTELVGHLPIYGALAVLLVWSPGAENLALWLRGLRESLLPVAPRESRQRASADVVGATHLPDAQRAAS